MKILVLCTGNRCRSQMAHGFLQNIDASLDVHSAGIKPADEVHPLAVKVMAEVGVDLSAHFPKSVDRYLNQQWDFVITVCGGANASCPVFTGKVGKRLHIGFDDPDAFKGTDTELMNEFRRVRDEIRDRMSQFYQAEVEPLIC